MKSIEMMLVQNLRSYELAKLAHKLDEGNIYSYDNYGLGNYYLLSNKLGKGC